MWKSKGGFLLQDCETPEIVVAGIVGKVVCDEVKSLDNVKTETPCRRRRSPMLLLGSSDDG